MAVSCSSSTLSISFLQELTCQPLKCLHKSQHIPWKDQSPPALQETKGGLDKCTLLLKKEQPHRICLGRQPEGSCSVWSCLDVTERKKGCSGSPSLLSSIICCFLRHSGGWYNPKFGDVGGRTVMESSRWGFFVCSGGRHLEPSRTFHGGTAVMASLGSPPLVRTCRFTPTGFFNSPSPPARMT